VYRPAPPPKAPASPQRRALRRGAISGGGIGIALGIYAGLETSEYSTFWGGSRREAFVAFSIAFGIVTAAGVLLGAIVAWFVWAAADARRSS
jgi:hypothetical protein